MKKIADPFDVVAVIVSYNPGDEFPENVHAILEQVATVIIVDNGSESTSLLKKTAELPGVEVIYNAGNLGIANALNQGFERAISDGFEYVLTFDQDSRPMPWMVEKLLSVYRIHLRAKQIAVVGPSIDDPVAEVKGRHLRPRGTVFFELVSCEQGCLEGITFVITSGALYRTDIYQKIGMFRGDFFIDYVDMEYCLKAKTFGYEILVNCDAHLIHRLGKRQKRVIMGRAEYPRFHSPLRWYYLSRNRIPMLKKYAVHFPYWCIYEFLNFSYGFLRMFLLEDQRIEKVTAFLRGTWDGLHGRLGAVSK
jgi:rhamnosyltransferase